MNYKKGISGDIDSEVDTFVHCITGEPETFSIQDGILTHITETAPLKENAFFAGPGLMDLQVNGIHGIDFNTPTLTQQDLLNATQYLLSKGVTMFYPTIITNSDENILQIAQTIQKACGANSLVNACVGGIHLEGPFISGADGAVGAHDKKYTRAPDWELFSRFQRAAGGQIKLVTLSPEWDGCCEFIEKCRAQGILVSIGHSIANAEQIKMAVRAGAMMSTHLGNGVPLMLPRHPNIIWDQLAADELYACIIADGIHIPDSFLKVVMKNKGNRTILVSDATCFAGLPPGEYQSHIGGAVILDEQKRVSLKSIPGILAGAGKTLLEDIEYLVFNKLATLANAWQMASINIKKMLDEYSHAASADINTDLVIFQVNGKEIKVVKTIKNNQVVYEQ
ncbi:MAG: hypothetical protein ABIN89_28015 [Chitinophagaceae bacterium]